MQEMDMTNPGHLFGVSEIEKFYANLLMEEGVIHTFHPTRFSDLLISNMPNLHKKTENKKVHFFF